MSDFIAQIWGEKLLLVISVNKKLRSFIATIRNDLYEVSINYDNYGHFAINLSN